MDNSIPHSPTRTRELDSRTIDGISVRLLWSEPDGKLYVTVADAKTGDAFSVVVRDPERSLEVFRHPYAYAAWYGIDTRADEVPLNTSLTS
jgi:hypothetical protein